MYHKFEEIEIPEGKNNVVETCPCGVRRIRYRSGGIRYIHPNDEIYGTAHKKCDREITAKAVNHPTTIIGNVKVSNNGPSVEDVPAPVVTSAYNRTAQPLAPTGRQVSNPHLEANLRDQLVVIRLMYEELVRNGLMHTQPCQMAGRYLYSNEHRALVEHLCPEHAAILSGASAQPVDGRSKNGRRTNKEEDDDN